MDRKQTRTMSGRRLIRNLAPALRLRRGVASSGDRGLHILFWHLKQAGVDGGISDAAHGVGDLLRAHLHFRAEAEARKAAGGREEGGAGREGADGLQAVELRLDGVAVRESARDP